MVWMVWRGPCELQGCFYRPCVITQQFCRKGETLSTCSSERAVSADLVFRVFSSLQACHPQFLYLKECYSSPKIKKLRPIGVREQMEYLVILIIDHRPGCLCGILQWGPGSPREGLLDVHSSPTLGGCCVPVVEQQS